MLEYFQLLIGSLKFNNTVGEMLYLLNSRRIRILTPRLPVSPFELVYLGRYGSSVEKNKRTVTVKHPNAPQSRHRKKRETQFAKLIIE